MKSNLRITAAARFVSLFMVVMILISGCGNANVEGTAGNDSEMSSGDGDVSVDNDTSDIVGGGTEDETESGTEPDDTELDGTEPDSEEPVTPQEPDVPQEPELTEEEKAWQNRILANVKNNLNVRKEPSTSGKIVGKLERGDYGEILEKGEEWTKIKSGNVVGYVSNEYCLYGNEALKLAKELAKTYATVTTNGLRVRKGPSTDTKIVTKLSKGDRIEVNEDIEPVDGWIAVIYEENTCYLSADYVSVAVEVSVGMTNEEIAEQKRIEEEKKKEEAARKQKEKEQKAVDNATDLELLAALIYCEAGAEPYEAQLAVGACVINRMKHRHYPDTLREVIFQKNQFTPAMSGKVARILIAGKTTTSCKKAAAAALAGEDNTGGCRSFRLASTGRKGIVYGKIVFFSNTP